MPGLESATFLGDDFGLFWQFFEDFKNFVAIQIILMTYRWWSRYAWCLAWKVRRGLWGRQLFAYRLFLTIFGLLDNFLTILGFFDNFLTIWIILMTYRWWSRYAWCLAWKVRRGLWGRQLFAYGPWQRWWWRRYTSSLVQRRCMAWKYNILN